jgi:CrcB protein
VSGPNSNIEWYSMQYLWIGIGSGIGGILRVILAEGVATLTGPQFPWGTVVINITGSLLIGLLAAVPGADGRPFLYSPMGQFLSAGVLGGYTTFSAFSLQTLGLLQQGQPGAAMLNVFLSVSVGLAATALGFVIGQALARPAPF